MYAYSEEFDDVNNFIIEQATPVIKKVKDCKLYVELNGVKLIINEDQFNAILELQDELTTAFYSIN